MPVHGCAVAPVAPVPPAPPAAAVPEPLVAVAAEEPKTPVKTPVLTRMRARTATATAPPTPEPTPTPILAAVLRPLAVLFESAEGVDTPVWITDKIDEMEFIVCVEDVVKLVIWEAVTVKTIVLVTSTVVWALRNKVLVTKLVARDVT
jgi:hypothetical protein